MAPLVKRLTAQLLRAEVSVFDFGDALAYLLEHRKLTDDQVLLRRATLLAAVVAYARPFTDNETGPNGEMTSQLAISPANVLTAPQLAVHDRALKLRHEALAHSDYAREQPQVLRIDGEHLLTAHFGFELLDVLSPLEFGPVIEAMFYAAQAKRQELRDRIKQTHG